MLFCCVMSILAWTGLVLMMLFCAVIRKDSVSLLKFPFLCRVQVFPCEILLICRLKCPYSWFSSHFCFLVIIVFLILVFLVLFLVTVLNFSLLFFMKSSRHLIDISTLSSMLASLFLLLFLTHIICLYHLWNIKLYASSLVFLFGGQFVKVFSSSTLRFILSILRVGNAHGFIALMRLLLYSWVSSSFLVLLRYSFLI